MKVTQGRAYILAAAAARYTLRPDADHALKRADHIAVFCRPLSSQRRATNGNILALQAAVVATPGSSSSDTQASWHALIALLVTESAHPAPEVGGEGTILRPVVTAAVRYALGRATYIVSEVCAAVRDLAAGL